LIVPFDKFNDECGVFGIYAHPDASAHAALGLHALQHRGQEAAGIISYDGQRFYIHRGLGHVSDNFGQEATIKKLVGNTAIGHVRYATSGDTSLRNVQPIYADLAKGGFALCHNGNLTNAISLRQELVQGGAIFQSTSDTEVIIHLMAAAKKRTPVEDLITALQQVQGAYSLVALARDQLIGVRDPWGVRPLVLGQLDGSPVLASESCALDILGAKLVRDVEPGEVVVISKNGVKSLFPFRPVSKRFCIFEFIYFARPDSHMEGTSVYQARKAIGAELAREHSVEADVVVPVPDSGVASALGYAEAAGLPFEMGIIRNHYVGRTFIEPTAQIRDLGVKLKHNANRGVLAGKRVVLVDDSIVRGTTSTKIVSLVRNAGAREVHFRVASPPIVNSCFYGVDTPDRDKLLAANMDLAEMARYIGADSLGFVSLDGLYRALGKAEGRNPNQPQFCDACLSHDYPIALTDHDQLYSMPAHSTLF
jgi:amidophosphoribosyltransferase